VPSPGFGVVCNEDELPRNGPLTYAKSSTCICSVAMGLWSDAVVAATKFADRSHLFWPLATRILGASLFELSSVKDNTCCRRRCWSSLLTIINHTCLIHNDTMAGLPFPSHSLRGGFSSDDVCQWFPLHNSCCRILNKNNYRYRTRGKAQPVRRLGWVDRTYGPNFVEKIAVSAGRPNNNNKLAFNNQ